MRAAGPRLARNAGKAANPPAGKRMVVEAERDATATDLDRRRCRRLPRHRSSHGRRAAERRRAPHSSRAEPRPPGSRLRPSRV